MGTVKMFFNRRKMTGIIILNWNGWEDTIACLKSLYQIEKGDFFIVLVDNGSINDSVDHLSAWLKDEDKKHYILGQGETLDVNLQNKDCILYCLKENYGFAKGNNYAIDLARKYSPDYLLLLNNDTEVEADFLWQLETFIQANEEYKVLTPMIRYFYDKNKIWNCGGKLIFGLRKYYYGDDLASSIKEENFIPISLITGCAFFFPIDLIENEKLFTEKYFFGEEDFDFSLRMQERGVKMACVLSSQIYHKVGASTAKVNNLSKIYIHYLDRYMDVKAHFSPLKFYIWKNIYYVYIILLLIRRGFSIKKIACFIKLLSKNHKIMDGVSQEYFSYVISHNIEDIE